MTRRSAGFTLIEVLLAFAVLAVAATVLLGLLSNGMRDVGDAERHGEAALHAQTLLNGAGRMERLRPGVTEGQLENGRWRWRMEVRQVPDPFPPPGPRSGPAAADGVFDAAEPVLYRIDLQLSWGAGGAREQLALATLRALYPLPDDR